MNKNLIYTDSHNGMLQFDIENITPESLREYANTLEENGISKAQITVDHEGYIFNLFQRFENDEEYARRIETEQIELERFKKEKAEQKNKKKEMERKEYERLKKKFETK